MTDDKNYMPIAEKLLRLELPGTEPSIDGIEVIYNSKHCNTNWFILVKKIKWKEREVQKSGWRESVGKTLFGTFYIGSNPQLFKGFELSKRGPIRGQPPLDNIRSVRSIYPTLEETKQVCQETFEAAILQCLGEDDDN